MTDESGSFFLGVITASRQSLNKRAVLRGVKERKTGQALNKGQLLQISLCLVESLKILSAGTQ